MAVLERHSADDRSSRPAGDARSRERRVGPVLTLEEGDVPDEVGLLGKQTRDLLAILLVDGALGVQNGPVVLVACHIGHSGTTSACRHYAK